jgi:hypothetical protein
MNYIPKSEATLFSTDSPKIPAAGYRHLTTQLEYRLMVKERDPWGLGYRKPRMATHRRQLYCY